MAEIMKVTTPLIPKENLGNRNKPVSDQAFELTDPSKVHKAGPEQSKIMDHQQGGQTALYDVVNKDMLAPLFRSGTDLLQAFKRIGLLLQMGVSTSDLANTDEIRQMLDSIYLPPERLAQALKEQDASAVLFRGHAFDLLRDILGKFPDNPKVREAVAQVLKGFEQNVNAENSIKTILITCRNLMDYMFTGDRAQFESYLNGLSEILLPQSAQANAPTTQAAEGAEPGTGMETGSAVEAEAGAKAGAQAVAEGDAEPASEIQREVPRAAGQPEKLGVEQREAAKILKGNLLPLLGEVVVKYNQNERIRDLVMVVVHNIVRVDQGTPENLQEAIGKLTSELKLVANLPENFQQQLENTLFAARDQVRTNGDGTMEKLTAVISEALFSGTSNAATLRQAETLLLSLLQNQSSAMNVLHFILPMEQNQGKVFAEMYVDPDSDEKAGRSKERSRKIFLSFESDQLGAFELSFVETGERVDFSLWCPSRFVPSLGVLKRHLGDIMQTHGYTMNNYKVAEFTEPHSVADVFPRLLERRMGVDVRI